MQGRYHSKNILLAEKENWMRARRYQGERKKSLKSHPNIFCMAITCADVGLQEPCSILLSVLV